MGGRQHSKFDYGLISLSHFGGDRVLTSLAFSLALLDECVLSETQGWFSRLDFMNGRNRPPVKLRTVFVAVKGGFYSLFCIRGIVSN